MAESPAHKFGQFIGDLLEEVMAPHLEEFCQAHGLYLDQKGDRKPARKGKKVTWEDKHGNRHDLDFVIERGGSKERVGTPLAFIETAWRRYTKHSRNKAQEIQGALLPIAEKHANEPPFLGVVLAGVFTESALAQMKTSGFEVVLFPYETITSAFEAIGLKTAFDENTPDAKFKEINKKLSELSQKKRQLLKSYLAKSNETLIAHFLDALHLTLDKKIEWILLVPLFGKESRFTCSHEAIDFLKKHHERIPKTAEFKKYEIMVRYANGSKVDASFLTKSGAIDFLLRLAGS